MDEVLDDADDFTPIAGDDAWGVGVPRVSDANGGPVEAGPCVELRGGVVDEQVAAEEGLVGGADDIGRGGGEVAGEPGRPVVRPGGAWGEGGSHEDDAADGAQGGDSFECMREQGKVEGESWGSEDIGCDRPEGGAEDTGEVEPGDVLDAEAGARTGGEGFEQGANEVGDDAVDVDAEGG